MGCGKSKQAVATGNTITKSRSSRVNPEKNKQAEQNVPQMKAIGNDRALLVQQEIGSAVSQDAGTAADVEDIIEHPEPEREDEIQEEETKAEDEDREEKKHVEGENETEPKQELGLDTEPVIEEAEAESGRFLSRDSPNHFFSSRREEEALEGIVSEGFSSEYSSPRHEPADEDVDNKMSVEENDATGLEKEGKLREKENDSAPEEEVVAHLATGEVAKSN